jgi:hypothetical protein
VPIPVSTRDPGLDGLWVGEQRAEHGDGDGTADLAAGVEHRAGGAGAPVEAWSSRTAMVRGMASGPPYEAPSEKPLITR